MCQGCETEPAKNSIVYFADSDFNWSLGLITVIPTKSRLMNFHPAAQLKGDIPGCLDFARHDKVFVRLELICEYSAALYWLIGIVIAATAIAVSFHFDDSVRDFMMQHQNPAMRNFMRYVSLLEDWPMHTAAGLFSWAWRGVGREEWSRTFLAMFLAMMLAGVAEP